MNKKEKSEIENLLKSIPNDFRAMENKISTKAIDEYYEIANELKGKNKAEIIQNQNKWRELKFSKEVKELLVYLSEIGDVKSYRKIEKIMKSGKSEILDFSYVALKFARLNLENNLFDEPIGFISTELGGKGNKLRYYFVVKSKDKIEKEKESKLINELKNICNQDYSEIEEIENHGRYILVKILVSIDIAIGNIIEKLTNKCVFLDEEYICDNVEKPTTKFIEKWMSNKLG
ncbi:hypothetical protein [Yeosuana sp.]|uniref:hypothetical protein n=1 Tax=Yeosuana sp. TaxID=2529388 RepID=UPI004054D1BF|tara:strand:+ start:15 stop:710 length:696 start_codon:yes stop_codon:yes gene_type:complete